MNTMADSAPAAAIDPSVKLEADVAAFLDDARAKAVGGLTVAEFGSLVISLLRLCVEGLDQIPSDGPAKKAWALNMVAILFDSIAGYAVPVTLQPVWFFARPAIRALVISAASGALEQVLHLSRAAAPATVVPA
jgi:hypothetical protein